MVGSHRHEQRLGGITSIVALLLIPIIALLAFAIDLNYIWCAQAKLQNAADATAHAATTELFQSNAEALSLSQTTGLPALLQTCRIHVVSTAQHYAALHQAGGSPLTVNDSDVVLGYLADPGSPSSPFLTGVLAPFPNSVQVTLRRDSTVNSGPMGLIFGPVFGVTQINLTATATGSLRGGQQQVTGFKGPGNRLLPMAVDSTIFAALTAQGAAPAGVTIQDNYTVQLPLAGGLPPPSNVTGGPDGVNEASIDVSRVGSGNFGWLSLDGSGGGNTPALRNWVLNGASAQDLANFGPNGLQVTAGAPATVFGVPGNRGGSLDTELSQIIGQQRVILVYDTCSGNGRNFSYNIIGFLGVVVIAADGHGNVIVQPAPTIDPSSTLAPSGTVGNATLVYQGVSFAR